MHSHVMQLIINGLDLTTLPVVTVLPNLTISLEHLLLCVQEGCFKLTI